MPRWVTAGFAVNPAPGQAGSYLGWRPRVYRLRATRDDVSCYGGEVAGGVLVAVENEPAVLAAVRPLGQGELGFHSPTIRARLRRWVERRCLDQRSAAPRGLVRELSSELGESGAVQRTGEAVVAEHPGDVQSLDHDRPARRGKPGGELVHRVPAHVRGACVQPRHAALSA